MWSPHWCANSLLRRGLPHAVRARRERREARRSSGGDNGAELIAAIEDRRDVLLNAAAKLHSVSLSLDLCWQSSSKLVPETDGAGVRSLELLTVLFLGTSPGVELKLSSYSRARAETYDFACSLEWRLEAGAVSAAHPDWARLCSASLEDTPTRARPNRQLMVCDTSNVTPLALSQLRAALFRTDASASAAMSEGAFVAILLAAAGATLGNGPPPQLVDTGDVWRPDAALVAQAEAACIPRDAPAFPTDTNWMEHAFRICAYAALPFDAYYRPRLDEAGGDEGSGFESFGGYDDDDVDDSSDDGGYSDFLAAAGTHAAAASAPYTMPVWPPSTSTWGDGWDDEGGDGDDMCDEDVGVPPSRGNVMSEEEEGAFDDEDDDLDDDLRLFVPRTIPPAHVSPLTTQALAHQLISSDFMQWGGEGLGEEVGMGEDTGRHTIF